MSKNPKYEEKLTITGLPGITASDWVVSNIRFKEESQETIACNDLQSTIDYEDYVLGLKTKGDVSVTLWGRPKVALGATGHIEVTDADNEVIFDEYVVVAETPDYSLSAGEHTQQEYTFKILPSGSRLLASS